MDHLQLIQDEHMAEIAAQMIGRPARFASERLFRPAKLQPMLGLVFFDISAADQFSQRGTHFKPPAIELRHGRRAVEHPLAGEERLDGGNRQATGFSTASAGLNQPMPRRTRQKTALLGVWFFERDATRPLRYTPTRKRLSTIAGRHVCRIPHADARWSVKFVTSRSRSKPRKPPAGFAHGRVKQSGASRPGSTAPANTAASRSRPMRADDKNTAPSVVASPHAISRLTTPPTTATFLAPRIPCMAKGSLAALIRCLGAQENAIQPGKAAARSAKMAMSWCWLQRAIRMPSARGRKTRRRNTSWSIVW